MKTIIASLCFPILLSCSSKIEEKPATVGPDQDTLVTTPPKAPTISYETIIKNTSGNISFYLPKSAEDQDTNFVVYFIDAHGRGNLPLKKYQKLSDEFGFILVGINTITNNLPTEKVLSAFAHAQKDIHKLIKAHKETMLIGFSGGARYATWLGTQDTNIIAVTGCAAGFAQPVNSSKDIPFDYLGLAGIHDFNYTEMMYLNEMVLDPYPRKHFVMSWNGKHEWPNDTAMYTAFTWFENLLTARKKLPQDIKRMEKRIDFLTPDFATIPSTRGKLPQLNLILERQKAEMMAFIFRHVTNIEAYDEQRKKVYAPDDFKRQLARHKTNLNIERQRQAQFAEYLQTKDTTWWKQTVETFRKRKNNAVWPDDMEIRILQYCSLQLYFATSGSLAQQQIEAAQKYSYLYTLVDPENPEAHYLRAKYWATIDQFERAIKSLKTAINTGFDDKKRLMNESVFQNIPNLDQFIFQ